MERGGENARRRVRTGHRPREEEGGVVQSGAQNGAIPISVDAGKSPLQPKSQISANSGFLKPPEISRDF